MDLRNKILLVIMLLVTSFVFAQQGDTLTANDTILHVPTYIRAIFTLHSPVTTFEIGEDETEKVWFPLAEMGFVITPTMVWDDYFLEFPIKVKTIPPFLDKYAAVGDISVAAFFRTYRNWGFGLEYRYIRAKYYPSNVLLDGHLWTLDIGVPYETLWLKGIKLEWLAAGKIEWYGATDRDITEFTGGAMMVAPYWTFNLEQGDIEIIFRTMFSSTFTGYQRDGDLYEPNTPAISEFEIHYTYP